MNDKIEAKKRRKQKAFLHGFSIKNTVNNLLTEERGWGIASLNVPQTWSVTKGSGVKVLVIDTGFTKHPDLISGMIKGQSKDFCGTERRLMDLNGHSTHCCGIIGARNNDSGVVGVAPECSIVTAKVLDRSGSGEITNIIKALQYAAKLKPDVISMSLGWYWHVPRVHNAIKLLHDMNIPIVAAAGNDGMNNSVNYPAIYPEVICVSAFAEDGSPAWFNSTGPEVDFSAPGVDVYSTWLKGRYAFASGTSMATPFMAGVVALLIAKHKAQEAETGNNDCKTVAEIKEHLIKYADDKGIIGKDNTWGYGVINLPELIGDTCTI